jgi:hypothetical protein
MLSGVVINTLPSVRDFVSSVEDRAVDLVKTPVMRKDRFRPNKDEESPSSTERSPLIQEGILTPNTRRYQQYLKFGQNPVLYKMGSMRAGASMSQDNQPKAKHIKYNAVSKLYHSQPSIGAKVALGPDGKPIKVGDQKRLARTTGTDTTTTTSDPKLSKLSSM